MTEYYLNAQAVTPDDNNNLVYDTNKPITTRGISIGVAGDLAIHDKDGNAVTLKNLAAGVIHPISTKRVLATGTVATEITAYW